MFRRSPLPARRTAAFAFAFAFAFAVVAFFGAFFEAFGADARSFEPTSVPSWARRAAERGVWRVASLESLNASRRFTSVDESLAFDAPADGVFDGSFSGALGRSLVLRGQLPPVESPTTTASRIGESTVYDSTSPFVLPPVTGDDPTFAPITPTLDEDATTVQKIFRYRDDVSASYMFVPKGDSSGLGMHEVEGRILFAFPWDTMRERTCFNNGFFLLTPSFKYNHWSQTDVPSAPFKMPDSTFDAGLTTLFATQLRDLEVKVEVSVGVASSFEKVDCDAFYIRGRAMGALPIDDAKQVKATGGLIYYDRIEYKIVPSGGIIWRPNEQNIVRLVYPDPRWSRYLGKLSNETDWWFYIGGEIGGGRWLIEDRGETFNTDYNDYRVGLGLTFDCDKMQGGFEIGGAFGRELVSKRGVWYAPKDAVYLKTGFKF